MLNASGWLGLHGLAGGHRRNTLTHSSIEWRWWVPVIPVKRGRCCQEFQRMQRILFRAMNRPHGPARSTPPPGFLSAAYSIEPNCMHECRLLCKLQGLCVHRTRHQAYGQETVLLRVHRVPGVMTYFYEPFCPRSQT
jgi:hypothetical protein